MRTMRENIGDTKVFEAGLTQMTKARQILEEVYSSLTEKGYDPINELVGYLMSGDPTYITNHRGARSLIMKADRDELVEEIMRAYIRSLKWEARKTA